MTRAAWTIDTPTVASDVIDGELVVMNLASGHYFSSVGTGATVWACLRQGWDLSAIVDAVADAYDAPRPRIEADVDAFIETLRSHHLLRPCEAAPRPEHRDTGAQRETYSPPEILVYSDMRDLLMLDPIHEVSEAGWPTRATESATAEEATP